MKNFLAIHTILFFLIFSMGVNAQTDSAQQAQPSFASADEAVNALVTAAEKNDLPALAALLGSGSEDILSSGDEVADKSARDNFLEAFKLKHQLVSEDENTMTLQVGENEWPLPIPVVKRDDKWLWDGAAGAEEIVYRRIGRNELGAIAVCHGFLDAQTEYAAEGRDGNEAGIYAAKLLSSPGRHDGLYWKTAEGETPSPAGDAVADAAEEGYRAAGAGERVPYHGYYYRMLFAQGANAPGGAQDYFVDGQLTQGVALLAWPAEYGVSGVTTFMINHDGVIYEKDLGDNTAVEVANIDAFNPDNSWSSSQQKTLDNLELADKPESVGEPEPVDKPEPVNKTEPADKPETSSGSRSARETGRPY
jgi:hypothetical protein